MKQKNVEWQFTATKLAHSCREEVFSLTLQVQKYGTLQKFELSPQNVILSKVC